jgi:hypothetical protein
MYNYSYMKNFYIFFFLNTQSLLGGILAGKGVQLPLNL